jgi:hypothetical protein
MFGQECGLRRISQRSVCVVVDVEERKKRKKGKLPLERA